MGILDDIFPQALCLRGERGYFKIYVHFMYVLGRHILKVWCQEGIFFGNLLFRILCFKENFFKDDDFEEIFVKEE